MSTTFVFMALAAASVTAFGSGWLLRGRQVSRAQVHATPTTCSAEQLDDRVPIERADLPPPRLSSRSQQTPAPAEGGRETIPAPQEVSVPTATSKPLGPRPELAPGKPLDARELAALSERERGAVLQKAHLEPSQIQVFDDEVRRLNDHIEDWLTDFEKNVGQIPGDRADTNSRNFMIGVLTYVTQAQGELTSKLGDRFAAAAEAVDFDLSSQIESHLIERLASVARPRT